MTRKGLCLGAVLLLAVTALPLAQAAMPIVSDSRIKTLVYNPNDVYSLLTHYGYQSNIEFGERETVETVSVGDRVAWQIIPAGRRLFIKAMEEGAHTNMTVVTNKRAYQFDLRSSDRTPLHPSEELVYVVRFFYPDSQSSLIPQMPAATAREMVAAPAPSPAYASTSLPVAQAAAKAINYQYTLSGPEAIAPVRIFDDGRSTYIRFRADFMQPVQILVPAVNGQLQPVSARRTQQGELQIDTVQPRLVIRSQGQQVIIYNEAQPSA